jgi:Domain of unknown function (DUF4345)
MANQARTLRIVIAVACLVPIGAGAAGVVTGPAMVGITAAPAGADSHFRYLSGLLLAIGLLFATTIRRIEQTGPRFRLLAAIVVIGGLCRLFGALVAGAADLTTVLALCMELGVTPALVLWQARVAARAVPP